MYVSIVPNIKVARTCLPMNDTARQVIQEIISQYGKVKFNETVHVIVADKEYMPTMINEFFSCLTDENKLPILPAIAIGHEVENISTSMMVYYQCFLSNTQSHGHQSWVFRA